MVRKSLVLNRSLIFNGGHRVTLSLTMQESCYDLVLGMDWLERHSPMWIHWKHKLLRFSHNGQRIALKGMKDSPTSCHKIKVRKLKCLIRKGGLAQVVHLCPVLTEPAPTVSTKAGRQSTLGYTHGSSLSVDSAQTTNSMVTQDTDKLFIQVRPPSWRNTYVLRLVVLICVERI